MRWCGVAIVLVCLGAWRVGGPAGAGTIDAASIATHWSRAAVWNPSMATVRSLREGCRAGGHPDPAKCLAATMRRTGASAEAMAFTKAIGGDGYMRELREAGPIGVALVQFPFRGLDTRSWFLVDGASPIIDVDDLSYLSQEALRQNPRYRDLAARYPQTLWPGERDGSEEPMVTRRADGGERIAVRYRLRDGCRTCPVVASTTYGFDFDASGTFQSAPLLAIDAPVAEAAAAPSAPAAAKLVVIGASTHAIAATVGQQFTLALPSSSTNGYQWWIAQPLDAALVQLLFTSHLTPSPSFPSTAAEERWTFQAIGAGETEIVMQPVADAPEGEDTAQPAPSLGAAPIKITIR